MASRAGGQQAVAWSPRAQAVGARARSKGRLTAAWSIDYKIGATRRFDTPKNHLRRDASLTAHAGSALLWPAGRGRVLLRLASRRALDPKLPHLPLEGRQARRWLGRQPLPRDSALRLVHGQRAGDALRGCRHRSRPPGRREPRPTPLRPPRQGLRTRPDCRRIRHTRREPSQAPRIINATPTQESLC